MKNIEIKDLYCFLAVAEEESFSKAAIRLSVAQPALSLRIQSLEEKLGTMVFDRTTRAVKLTNAGEVFYTEAKEIMLKLSQAVLATQSMGRGESGILRIGYTRRGSFSLLPAMLRKINTALPKLRLETYNPMTTSELYTQVRNGSLDLALTYFKDELDNQLRHERLTESELVIILANSHPLARRKKISIKDCSHENFVAYPAMGGYYMRSLTEKLCNEAGFSPRIIKESEDTQALLCFIATGQYISLLPEEVKEYKIDGLVYKRISPVRVMAHHGAISLKKNHNPALPLALSILHDLAAAKTNR
jgi:DNA-binding transcriptional LysR family regulator